MTAAHAAALEVAKESYGMLREALAGLPDEAMDWRPAPDANPLGVLVLHSISATRFWFAAGSGESVSLSTYRNEERAPAFQAAGKRRTELEAAIDSALPELESLLRQGSADDLDATCSWPEDPGMTKTGVQCLMHALAHLREHVGQAQLTRDLWLAHAESK
ncbi:MAG: DinB family protein [Dehalococcoidia bacterium]|nr:DinB family protein [Dehalococcoidia bacterium]